MAHSKNVRQVSLKKNLQHWMIIITVIYAIISTTIIGFISYDEAKEQQDDLLSEVADLILSGRIQLNDRDTYQKYSDHDRHIIIQDLDKDNLPPVFAKIKDINNSWSTRIFDDEEWRIYKVKSDDPELNFLIAQQTEKRNEYAWNSCVNFSIPSISLLIVLIIIVNLIIRKYFKPIEKLNLELSKQEPTTLKKLSEEGIFVEMLPFLKAINLLLDKSNNYINKQQQFINNAAHELRTPIAAISLQVENLSNTTDIQQKKERETTLVTGISRLRKMVNQLLDLSRIKNNQNQIMKKVSFLEIIKNTIENFYPLIEGKDLDINVQSKGIIYVTNYLNLLEYLVRNIIDNAIKYSPIKNKIIIKLTTHDGNAVFSVENFGVMIPDEDLDHVTEPFYRSNQTIEGNGLGLSICQEVAKNLNGKFEIKNTKNNSVICTYIQNVV